MPFEKATFSKLASIGNDGRLQKPALRRVLPPHFTALYALTQLNDAELNEAVQNNKIHQNTTRGEIQALRRREPPKKAKLASTPNVRHDATEDPTDRCRLLFQDFGERDPTALADSDEQKFDSLKTAWAHDCKLQWAKASNQVRTRFRDWLGSIDYASGDSAS